jgi:hypothetical protein
MTAATQAAPAKVTYLNATVTPLQEQLKAVQELLEASNHGRGKALEQKVAAETEVGSFNRI